MSMPIPETPITRAEQYLNAIATSDTSNIPATPMTREEMYLDHIARNGGGGGGGGSSTLSGLTDVDISSPTDGQTLMFNDTSCKWENGAGGGGVRVIDGVYSEEDTQISTTITAAELLAAYLSGKVVVRWIMSVEGPSGSLVLNEYGHLYAVEDAGEYGVIFYASSAQADLRSSPTPPANMVAFDVSSK